jgi:putative tricarboxylic transport membrane protein
MLEYLGPSAALFFSISNFLFISIGILVGIFIGAIPGLNVPMTIALFLPVTYSMSPLAGIMLLIGIYKGGTYGGSISAILINTPGVPAAAATVLDGYPLAKQGKAGKALKMSLYASVFGEIISDLVLFSIAPTIALFSLRFGPIERFSLVLFAFTVIGLVSGDRPLKGLIAGMLGVFFASVGLDDLSAASRYTFDITNLDGGIPFLPFVIGLFAISEAFVQIEKKAAPGVDAALVKISKRKEDNSVSFKEFKSCLKTLFRSSAIGTCIGALPGTGSAISAFVSYGMAKASSKHPEEFGKGSLEGVAAAECGNNSVTGATLIPLLTLGIPGDAITAILLGAFLVHGMTPGPDLFTNQGVMTYAIFIGMFITNLLHLVIAYLGLPLFIRGIRISKSILFPIVIVFCFVGAYANKSSMFDFLMTIVFGVVGYAMRKFSYPLAPMLLGFILGPMLEKYFRQALVISERDYTIFFRKPISLFFMIVTILFVAWTVHKMSRARRQAKGQ